MENGNRLPYMNTTKTNCIYVNPNFKFRAGNPAPNGLHINPNFKIDYSELTKESLPNLFPRNYPTDLIENNVNPKIHINPKVIQLTNNVSQQYTFENISVIAHSKYNPTYALQSKNDGTSQRGIASRKEFIVDKQPTVEAVKTISAPRKPSYSLVRNVKKVETTMVESGANNKVQPLAPIVKPILVPRKPSYSLVRNVKIAETSSPSFALKKYYSELIKMKAASKGTVGCASKNLQFIKQQKTPLSKPKYKVWSTPYTKHAAHKYKIRNNVESKRSKFKIVNATIAVERRISLKNTTILNKFVNKLRSGSFKTSSSQFVFIGGDKFVVTDRQLKKVINRSPPIKDNMRRTSGGNTVKRINLNGIAFVRKSDNLFVLDNRCLNSNKIHKKMNIVCPVYKRTGVCVRNDRKKCPFVHNPKNISICPNFLKGTCKIEGCHLSHDVVKEKMPTCKYFLDGCCTRDPCPYLHVKVSESAKVCSQFLEGYCAAGVNCDKQHINVCPDYQRYSKCEKKNCKYPHRKIENKELRIFPNTRVDSKSFKCNTQSLDGPETNTPLPQRYFDENSSNKTEISNEGATPENSSGNVAYKGKTKLGHLPSYISLE